MRVPIATVTVDEPTALSLLNAPGWSGDFRFVEDDFKGDVWELGGIGGTGGRAEYIPSMEAIGPQGQVERVDMNLADWTVNAGSWVDTARPAMNPRTQFLWAYDGTPDTAAAVESKDDWRPQWCAWVGRYAPPEGTTQPCWFAFEMLGDGVNPAWALVVPTWDPDGRTWPYLMRDDVPYGAGSYYTYQDYAAMVSHLEVDTVLDTAWAEYIIWCELTLNQWIIRMTVNGSPISEPWVYQVPDYSIIDPDSTPCGEGKLRICSQGQQLMAAVAPITYPTYSYARPRQYSVLAEGFGDPSHILAEALWQGATGTTVVVSADVSGQNVRPLVEFGNPVGSRAVCGLVSMVLPADLGSASINPWTSTGTNQLMDGVQYTRRITWRGNSMNFTVRDPDGALDWKGNNVVTLDLGWQESAEGYGYPYAYDPTMRRVFTGYITDIKRRKTGTEDLVLEITAEDYWGARMPHKSMVYMASFGGQLFAEAFADVANRLGFREDQIDCVDAENVRLSTAEIIGRQTFAFAAEDNPGDALDAFCKERGWRCGIDAEGNIFAAMPYAYSGTPDFILDQDTVTEADVVTDLSAGLDLSEFANSVVAYVGPEEQRSEKWLADEDSWQLSSTDDYIGDLWWRIEKRERGLGQTMADAVAAAVLAKVSTFRQVITWETEGRDLSPGQFVQVQVDVPGVETDSVYMITEEQGFVRFDDLEWSQTFTMVRVQ